MLVADGGDAEREATGGVLAQSPFVSTVRFVDDGPALLEALHEPGDPLPSLVVLDLGEGPARGAAGTLVELKGDERLRRIPVVVVTGAGPVAVRHAYELGASSCVARPANLDERHALLAGIAEYWSQVVTLPG